MKIKDLPKHLRPREKMIEKGVENLRDFELLAILLRTGVRGKNAIELSKYILNKFPTEKFVDLKLEELLLIDGVDAGKASTILASIELVKRATKKHSNNLPMILSSQDVVDQMTDTRVKKKENFVALYLNARNQLMQKELISVGTLNMSLVHPRDVFEPAIRYNSAQIIIVHNHPSGDPSPSDADLQVTKKLIESGKILGIELADHIIVTKDEYVSMKEEGYV